MFNIPDGNLIKEKGEYLRTKFLTKQGIVDTLVGGFIFGYLIVNFTPQAYAKIKGFISISPMLDNYIAYLIFGLIMSIVGYYLSVVIIYLFNLIRGKI